MKRFELLPLRDRAKSFYGKATVTEYNEKLIVLTSYNTEVCRIENGKFIRMWGGYSSTTMRHVNEFIYQYGIMGGGAAWWRALPVDERNIITNILQEIA